MMTNVVDFSTYDASSGLHADANELYQGVADGTIDRVILASCGDEYYTDQDVSYLLEGIRPNKVIMDYGHLKLCFLRRNVRADEYVRLLPSLRDAAARLIQRYWMMAAYDPTRSMCKSRLTKRWQEFGDSQIVRIILTTTA